MTREVVRAVLLLVGLGVAFAAVVALTLVMPS